MKLPDLILQFGIAGALAVGGAWAVWRGLRERRLSRAAVHRWTETNAKILQSRVDREAEPREEREDGRLRGPRWRYKPYVQYNYRIEGTERYGTTIHFNPPSSLDEGAMAAIAARYKPGATVKLYVDPADPENTVLEPAVEGSSLLFWVGFPLAAIGLFRLVQLLIKTQAP